MPADATGHFCPGCGAPQKAYPRYPWYFCGACVERAEDWQGRGLAFANAALSGGLSWTYRDGRAEPRHDDLEVMCLIKGRPVLVTEARFGGVVAQPVPGDARLEEGPFGRRDLTRAPSSGAKS